MSLNSLANAAAARRPDFMPPGVPQGLAEVAAAAGSPPTPITRALAPTAGSSPPPPPPVASADAVTTALNVLFGYIPSEILTLYVPILAAIHHSGNKASGTEWGTFWAFLGSTPLVVWLIYAAKIKAAKKPLPARIGEWPQWEMFAGTAAYFAWAFALPNSPFNDYAESWYSPALAGIIVLVSSTVLGLLAPFFQRPIAT